MIKRRTHYILIFPLLAILISGCAPTEENPDARDEKDPLVRDALVQIAAQDFSAALRSLESALDKKPQLARADLEAARIYHVDPDNRDYPCAIYHYRRYLEKRPDTNKTEVIEKWIQQAQLSFAADILRSSPNNFMVEVNRLKRENASLRRQVDQFTSTNMAPNAPEPAQPLIATTEPIAPPPAPEPAPKLEPKPAPRSYTVQSGDTLSKISRKMYNDTAKWRIIYEANRSSMKSERDLKIGKSIIIPTLNENADPRG